MKALLFQMLNPWSDETNSIITRGILGIATMVGGMKFSAGAVEHWVRFGSTVVTFLVGLVTLISMCFSLYRQWLKWKARKHSDSSSSALAVLLFAVLMLSGGCGGLVPSERQRSESVKATENLAVEQEKTIRRTLTALPQTLAGPQAIREDLTFETVTRTGAGSKASAAGSSEISIPLFVKIIGLAIGLVLLALAVWWLWGFLRTTAFGQGISLADDMAARQIRKLRERAVLADDAAEKAKLATDIADLESERGKLAGRRTLAGSR